MQNLNQNKIRIAFMEARYDSFYGAQQSMYTLITQLDNNMFHPIMLTTEEGELAKNFRQAGIEVHVIPLGAIANVFGKQITSYSKWKKIKVLLELIKYNFKLLKWLRHNNIDILYTNDARALVCSGLTAKFNKIPIIWYVRADQRFDLLYKFSVFTADRIITIANGVRKAFTQKELIKYSNKFANLYTGFDVEVYKLKSVNNKVGRIEKGVPENSIVIGLVGSVTPRKGYDFLIEAAPELLKKYNAHFLLVGDVSEGYYDYKKQLEQRINELNLSKNVHWVGFTDDPASMYALMDVFVLPSRYEGLPRTVIEALSAGLPVVASNVGGVKEIITSQELGKVIPVDNSIELANAIVDVIENELESYKKQRYQYVKRHFSIESYVQGFQDICYSLINNKK